MGIWQNGKRVAEKSIARRIAEEEILATPPEADVLELHAVRSVARVDAAVASYSRNRHMPQRDLVDALLEVRHALWRGLQHRTQIDGPTARPYVEAQP